MTTFVSFNINGLRARPHQLQAIKDLLNADIIGLQETKVHDEAFPLSVIDALGYHVEFFGQKSHYGVAILSKNPPIFVQKGFPFAPTDAQRRLIHARFNINGRQIDVINGYFPQGESRHHPTKFAMKQAFYQDLNHYIDQSISEGRELIVMGDMNIAPQDNDIGFYPDTIKRWMDKEVCSFLPEERQWYQSLLSRQLIDTYRQLKPHTQDEFSWFDYRSRGFENTPKQGLRIDHILCSPKLAEHCVDVGISYEIRSQDKPSDHAPVWAKFTF